MRFHQTSSRQAPRLVTEKAAHHPLLSGAVDLNGDGTQEVLYKTDNTGCHRDKGCPYYITAKKQDSWIVIGEFEGFNLLISDKRTYGIRDILVYNVPYNDFESVRYVWNPKRYKYEPKT